MAAVREPTLCLARPAASVEAPISLEGFADELVLAVLSKLDYRSLCRAILVNTRLRSLASCNVLWRQLCFKKWRNKQAQQSRWDRLNSEWSQLQNLSRVADAPREGLCGFWLKQFAIALDSSRTLSLTNQTLLSHDWEVKFTESAGGDMSYRGKPARFRENHTLELEHYPPLPWCIDDARDDVLLIANFPPHRVRSPTLKESSNAGGGVIWDQRCVWRVKIRATM
ncbi:hypothetical protein CYMTET_18700 [Cymbomonas tetramitiformis]|uniref:F-box domain-containing protein n=1 Tax=Cymbomonas tetramitiformis TaxID=36881 RepID=A0AAE0G7S5_9CHLO|nr:hypothetical protein CYMTET_18700 [Cymbomonas tetramitiformis]